MCRSLPASFVDAVYLCGGDSLTVPPIIRRGNALSGSPRGGAPDDVVPKPANDSPGAVVADYHRAVPFTACNVSYGSGFGYSDGWPSVFSAHC
jgi:hypothetical protein